MSHGPRPIGTPTGNRPRDTSTRPSVNSSSFPSQALSASVATGSNVVQSPSTASPDMLPAGIE